jgi:site-specific DNA-methyltransferase (adenine-specific)
VNVTENSVHHAEFMDLCAAMPDASADMILCDLPYGSTTCAWDTVIPFEPMWKAFKRIINPEGAIVLTASQPFTSALVMSNPKMFRYEWIWHKSTGGGFLNANRQPLKRHENILVFYNKRGVYQPQMSEGKPYVNSRGKTDIQVNNGGKSNIVGYVTVNTGSRYPTSILEYKNDTGLHPTQKPLELFRYLIRTYTLPDQMVFDPCVGSGTTAAAAQTEGRKFIVGDSSVEHIDIAHKRLEAQ